MKNIKPFGPSLGKTKISKKFLNILNKEIDNKVLTNIFAIFLLITSARMFLEIF